uniref:Integrase catalytic domain-containing protein n=1 Tax=Strongyloides venezuelensis TaxID=75913 RepID=A0A0K0FHF8_STRVS
MACQMSVPRNEPTVEQRLVACGIPRYSYTIDLCGPLNKATSSLHHKYIILAVDTATRYLMYSTTDDTSSVALARKIRDEILFPYGKPTILRLDNAKYFKGHDFSDTMAREGIQVRFGTPYSHTSQTLVERGFRIIQEGLRKFLQDQTNHWDLMLPRVVYLHNHSPNALGFTPAQIFMKDFSTPVLSNVVKPMNTAHFTLKQDISILKALLSIQQNLLQNQKIPKTPYKTGDLVLVRDRNPKLSKFNFLYKGPFKVTQVGHLKVHYISSTGKEKIAYYKDCKLHKGHT